MGRVGDARPDIDVGMNSFDPSAVDISLLGHSYIGAARSVLADFGELILDNRSPDRRFGVLSKGQPPKQWWVGHSAKKSRPIWNLFRQGFTSKLRSLIPLGSVSTNGSQKLFRQQTSRILTRRALVCG